MSNWSHVAQLLPCLKTKRVYVGDVRVGDLVVQDWNDSCLCQVASIHERENLHPLINKDVPRAGLEFLDAWKSGAGGGHLQGTQHETHVTIIDRRAVDKYGALNALNDDLKGFR